MLIVTRIWELNYAKSLPHKYFFYHINFMCIILRSLSPVQLYTTPWTKACQAPLARYPLQTISWSLLKFMAIESVMLSNHFILCHPLLFLPSIFPSFRVFSNELVLQARLPKYWIFNLRISPSNEYSGLISFRID